MSRVQMVKGGNGLNGCDFAFSRYASGIRAMIAGESSAT
jgi:hypothetical protein